MSDQTLPKILFIGGPDVDTRIELMRHLSIQFQIQAAGSSHQIAENFRAAGFTYYHYPLGQKTNPFSYLISLITLFLIIRKEKPSIVHTFDTKPAVVGRLAARLARTPIVVGTITGLGSLYIIQEDLTGLRIRPLYEALQKVMCQISDLTIFYTQDDASFFTSKKLAPPQKMVILPGSGITLERFAPNILPSQQIEEIKNELGIPKNFIVITMVGRLVRSKGVLLFAEAARRVKTIHPETYFLLIGPRDPESLDALSTEEMNTICETISWIGHQPQIEKFLAITDIFVLPAGREGIPRVLAEAAAMGLPLIATDLPGCREVVRDGINGFLIPPNDPGAIEQRIIKMMTNPELRKQFSAASRQHAQENFDLVKIASRLKDIYANLLTQKGIAL